MTPVVVYDCMVFLQALVSDKGPAFACMQRVEEGRVQLVISSAILAEVGDVLNRFENLIDTFKLNHAALGPLIWQFSPETGAASRGQSYQLVELIASEK